MTAPHLFARAGWRTNGVEHAEQATATSYDDLRRQVDRLRVRHASKDAFYLEAWELTTDPAGQIRRRDLTVREQLGAPMRYQPPTEETE